MGGSCCSCCCDRGKTKSTPRPKTEVSNWDWSVTKIESNLSWPRRSLTEKQILQDELAIRSLSSEQEGGKAQLSRVCSKIVTNLEF